MKLLVIFTIILGLSLSCEGRIDLFMHENNARVLGLLNSKKFHRFNSLQDVTCDVSSLYQRIRSCVLPFTSWDAKDWNGVNSVHSACTSDCQKALNGFSEYDWLCLRALDPGLTGIMKSMCVKSEAGQFCGEPYAAMYRFAECSKMSEVECKATPACAYENEGCRASYAPALMEKMCTSCVNVMMASLSGNGVSSTVTVPMEKAIQTMCVQHNGVFCAHHLSDPRWDSSDTLISYTRQQIQELCTVPLSNQCYLKLNRLASNFYEIQTSLKYHECAEKCKDGSCDANSCGTNYQQLEKRVAQWRIIDDNLCTITANGEYCMALPEGEHSSSSPKVFSQCFENTFAEQNACTTTCSAVFRQDITNAKFGCCASVLLSVINAPTPPIPLSTPWVTAQPSTTLVDFNRCGGVPPLSSNGCNSSINGTQNADNNAHRHTFNLNVGWERLVEANLTSDLARNMVLDLTAAFGLVTEKSVAVSLDRNNEVTVQFTQLTKRQENLHATTVAVAFQGPFASSAVSQLQTSVEHGTLSLPLSYQMLLIDCHKVGGCVGKGTFVLGRETPSSSSSQQRLKMLLLLSTLMIFL